MKLNLESRLKDGFSFVKKKLNYALLPLTLLTGMYQSPSYASKLGDGNEDSQVNVLDIQSSIGQALGTRPFIPRDDTNRDGITNVLDIQQHIRTALGIDPLQDVYDMTGKIVDLETENGLNNGTITFIDQATGNGHYTFLTKNSLGEFEAYNIPQGEYRFVIDAPGFVTHTSSRYTLDDHFAKDFGLIPGQYETFVHNLLRLPEGRFQKNDSFFSTGILYIHRSISLGSTRINVRTSTGSSRHSYN